MLLGVALGARVSRAADPVRIPLTVRETGGVARTAWPVTSGVPFPRGVLPAAAACRLVDPAGQEVPLQTRRLASWEDGSVKWLLVDFQSDLGAGEQVVYRLECGAGTSRSTFASPLAVDSLPDGVAVTTGPLAFVVPAGRFALFSQVSVDGELLVGGDATASIAYAGGDGPALAPEELRVVAAGPLRAEIELAGHHQGGFAYRVRVEAFAGKRFIRVRYAFANQSDTLYTEVRDVRLFLPLSFPGLAHFALGGDGAVIEGDVARGVTLLQSGGPVQGPGPPAGEPWFGVTGDASASGSRATGWADLSGGPGGVTAAVRYFWQEYPKSFHLDAQGVSVGVWAAEDGSTLESAAGMMKTTEVLWYFHRGDYAAAGSATVSRGFAAPLFAFAPPGWVAATGALPSAVSPSSLPDPGFLARLAGAYAGYLDRVEAGNFFGFTNWGDWYFDGAGEWGNLEYDLCAALALAGAATAEPLYLDGLEAAARHFRDIDLIHYSAQHPDWVGTAHPHEPLHFCWDCGTTVDLGHTWAEGLVAHYYLTGDQWSLEAARGVGDYLARRVGGVSDKNPRQWGWPMIALEAVYRATLDTTYLRALAQYARKALADTDTNPPDPRPCGPGNDHDHGWKLGIMADGLSRYHRLAGDPAARRWILAYAQAVVDAASACGGGAGTDARYLPAVAYAFVLTGDQAYRDFVQAGLAALPSSSDGKPFSYQVNVAFRAYSLLDGTLPPAGGVPGVHDPGFPYVDGNGDALFSAALAGAVDFGPANGVRIKRGFDATTRYPGAGIVIPPGGSFARRRALTVRADGDIVVSGTVRTRKKKAVLTLESTHGRIVLGHAEGGGGPVLAGTVRGRGDVRLVAQGGIQAYFGPGAAARVVAGRSGSVTLDSGQDLDLRGATLAAGSRGDVTLCGSPGRVVMVEGADLGDADGVDVGPAGVVIEGTPASGTINPGAAPCGAGGGGPPDSTPPVISALAVTSVTSSGATVTWTTDEPATGQVEYGLTASYGSLGPLDPGLVTSHSARVSGLSAGTLYHVRVRSRDAAGNEALSGDLTFTTAPSSPSAGVHDPGFAYVDGDNDGLFSAGLAGQVDFGPAEGVQITGSFDASAGFPGAGIVVPPSGSITSRTAIALRAEGNIVVTGLLRTTRKNAGVELTSTAGDVMLVSAGPPLVAGRIVARGRVVVQASGAVVAGGPGVEITTDGTGAIEIAAGGDLSLQSARLAVSPRGGIVLCAGGPARTIAIAGADLVDVDGVDVAPVGVEIVGLPTTGSVNPVLASCPF